MRKKPKFHLDGREDGQLGNLTRRAALLGAAQLAVFGGLAGRVYYLQVIESDQYKLLAEENRISLRLVAPQRGRILDRFGTELATSRQNFQVVLVPERSESLADTLDALSNLITISDAQYARILREAKSYGGNVPLVVAENLSWEEFAQINVNSPRLRGVQPVVGETRDYPFGAEVAHLVGYVATPTKNDLLHAKTQDPLFRLPGFKIGRSGVEQIHDIALRGSAGSQRVEVNAYDRVIRELSVQPAIAGQDVQLTLDYRLQRAAVAALAGQTGAVVCLGVQNGDILAMASTPGFDPNAFNVGLSNAQWQTLLNDPRKPFINKAVSGLYPPGSTIKPVVALAALAAGISPQEKIFCNGKVQLGDQIFHCWREYGHGAVDLHDSLKLSCDVYYYEIARRIGIEPIARMAAKFGLGETVTLGLPGEKYGIFPTPEWKRRRLGKPWVGGETLVAAIGQGYVQSTPLQLAVMTALFANGGNIVRPHLFTDERQDARADPQNFAVPRKHLQMVRDAMADVVNSPDGTASGVRATNPEWQFAGKTGTAQVRRISLREREREEGVTKNEDLPWAQRDHALFVGFAPVAAPRYAVSVVVEHGGSGSKVAAPIARRVLLSALENDPLSRPITRPKNNDSV